MGVPTKHVKRTIQFPDCVYPARDGRTISVAGALAVLHVPGVVITVLWNGSEGRDSCACVALALTAERTRLASSSDQPLPQGSF